jgi:hypothetical protein
MLCSWVWWEGGRRLTCLYPTPPAAMNRFVSVYVSYSERLWNLRSSVHKQEGKRLVNKSTVCSSAPLGQEKFQQNLWRIHRILWIWNLFCCYLLTVCLTTERSYGLDDRGVGVRVPVWSRIFSSPRRPYRLWGPPNLLSNGYRWLFSSGVKRPGREADLSPPTSAKVKKIWILDIHSPIRLHGVVLN